MAAGDQLVLDGLEPALEEPVGVVAVCWRCGARSEPIPASSIGRSTWSEGVAWALLALHQHAPDCPGVPTT